MDYAKEGSERDLPPALSSDLVYEALMKLPKNLRFDHKYVARLAIAGLVAIAVANALHVLWSLLGGAYSADDIWNSQFPAQLHATHQSILSFIVATTKGWMKSSGRFFPTSIAEGTLVFNIFQTRFSYKVFLISAVMADLVLAYLFLARLTRQRWTAYLFVILVVAGFEFRFFYDGIQEFSGQQEVMLALVLIAANSTLNYLDSGKRVWLIVTAVVWALALTTYETSYLMLPILWIAMWHRHPPRERVIAGIASSALPMMLIGGYVLYLRLALTAGTAASYTADLSPPKVFTTLGKQVVGTLPFSEFYLGGSRDLTGILTAPHWSVFSGVLFVLVAGAIAQALRHQTLAPRDDAALFAIGVVLLFGPAIIVAATETWQGTLTWGIAYISAYTQGFGFVLIFLALLDVLLRKIRSISRHNLMLSMQIGLIAVVSVMGSLVILGVAGENVRVINVNDPSLGWMNQQASIGWSRQIVTDAERSGLFGSGGRMDKVAAITGAAWINSNEISYESGQSVDVVNAYPYWTLGAQASTQVPGCPLAVGRCKPSRQYQSILYVGANAYNNGYSVLGGFRSAFSLSSAPDDVVAVVKDPTIFVENPAISSTARVTLCRIGRGSVLHEIRALKVVRSGSHWRLLQGGPRFRVAVSTIGLVISHRCETL